MGGAMGIIAPELPEEFGGLGLGRLAAGVPRCSAAQSGR
jgi:hypothetical protein